MNGSDLARGVADQLFKLMLFIAVVASLLTCAVIFGAPWLWGILKPWLHSITG